MIGRELDDELVRNVNAAMDAADQKTVEAALAADREGALRDVFAAAAFGAIIAHSGPYYDRRNQLLQAQQAYLYADAMLKARKS